MTAQPGETLVASKDGSDYDLALYKKNNLHTAVIFMKVQFFFKDGDGGDWTSGEKTTFVSTWKKQVQSKWGTSSIAKDKNNVSVPLEFRFETKIGGFMWDHWELTVTKIKPGDFKGSWVRNGIWNNSALDSEDVVLTPKGHGKKQRGTVHEFGHMLGLADEYKDSSAHKSDYASVMNRGEVIYPRHRKKFADWVSAKL